MRVRRQFVARVERILVGPLGVGTVETEIQVGGQSVYSLVRIPYHCWVDEGVVICSNLGEVLTTLGQRTGHHMPSLLQ
jgi:hypothetical protein